MTIIKPGQRYEPVRCPRCGGSTNCPDHGKPHLIQVTGHRIPPLLGRGVGKVEIATVTEDGRLIRKRLINASQLHLSATTQDGKPRSTGYRLVQDVPS